MRTFSSVANASISFKGTFAIVRLTFVINHLVQERDNRRKYYFTLRGVSFDLVSSGDLADGNALPRVELNCGLGREAGGLLLQVQINTTTRYDKKYTQRKSVKVFRKNGPLINDLLTLANSRFYVRLEQGERQDCVIHGS